MLGVRSPPLEWLMALNRQWICNFMYLVAVGILFNLLNLGRQVGFMVSAVWACCLGLTLSSACLVRSRASAFWFEIISFAWLLSVSVGTCLIFSYGINDYFLRQRSLAIQLVLYKPWPGIFGMRMMPTFVYMLVSGCADGLALWISNLKHGDSIPVATYVQIWTWPILFGVCAMVQQRRFRSWYDLQEELAAEKDAFASLLSMVSDAAIWVAADGETILSSDQRLDSLLGKATLASKLSDHVPNGEQERLRTALLNSTQVTAPVCMLPVTFVRRSADPVVVDLFIVDRRKAFADAAVQEPMNRKRGFLLGLRVTSQIGAADLVPCWEDNDAKPLTLSQQAYKPKQQLTYKQRLACSSRSQSAADADSCSESDASSSHAESSTSAAGAMSKRLGCAHGLPFIPSTRYSAECSLSMLEDLLACWNFEESGCCQWHARLSRLSRQVESMHSWHRCDEKWVASVFGQCDNCNCMLTTSDAACWVCGSLPDDSSCSDLNVDDDPPGIRKRVVSSSTDAPSADLCSNSSSRLVFK